MLKNLLILLLTLSTLLLAEVKETTTTQNAQGVGIGLTRGDAVNNAIIEALGQIDGIRINKETIVDSATINSTEGNAAAYTYNSRISKITKGKVDSYSILDVIERTDGQFQATVEITKTKTTKEYKTPGLDPKARRSLAIIPAYSNYAAFTVMGQQKSGKDVSQRLTQELVSAITKTRKFTVLDREANQAYQNEKNLLRSKDAAPDELLKLGNVLGADYLFVSNITEFRVNREIETVQITGQSSESLKAFATIQYRILAMATRQVKWSSTTTFEFEPKGESFEQVYLEVLKKISDDLTYEIIENIYPIKIADISSGNQIILSQGGVPKGTQYEVYTLGKKLYDPYTKEYLGQDEVFSGVIEITRSLPKISYGTIISGTAKKGDICRKVSQSSQDAPISRDLTEADKPSEVQQEAGGGGVKLPFD